jgi:hypothetical protein
MPGNAMFGSGCRTAPLSPILFEKRGNDLEGRITVSDTTNNIAQDGMLK